ncbi:AMP-binding protein [Kribbella sp. WER1]
MSDGIRPDQVGQLVEPSANLLNLVIGVLKAGSAHVYPAPRPRCSAHDVDVAGSDLAYVIHTSRSTGGPNLCIVNNDCVLAFLTRFDLDHPDRVALFVLDAFVWELSAALPTGAAALVSPERAARHLPDFFSLILKESVTINSQVPTSFRALVDAHDAAGRPELALRYLVLGGEPAQIIDKFLSKHQESGPTVVKVYGPIDATCITSRGLTPENLDSEARSPIGHPLPHLRVRVRRVRIEPGEVEAALRASALVVDAAAMIVQTWLAPGFSSPAWCRPSPSRSAHPARWVTSCARTCLGRASVPRATASTSIPPSR